MQQEGKAPAFWQRRPGVTLLIAGVLVYLAGAVADSTIVMAFGLFFMMLAGLVGCLQTVRFVVREMTPRGQAENGVHAKRVPASGINPVDEVREEHRAGRALTTVAEARECEEDLRQFLEAVEREELRQFVKGTLAQKAIAEGGLEVRHSALRQEVRALIEEFKLTQDLALLSKIQALNREADRLKP
jgi:hypothetical protein